MDQPGAGNRPGIDHRIERPVVVGEPDRIERLAAGLDADRRRNPLFADHFQRQRKHERLGNRLDGERHRAVADFVDVAVDGDERDAEMRRIGPLQFGDIVGDGPGIVRPEFSRGSWSGIAAAEAVWRIRNFWLGSWCWSDG